MQVKDLTVEELKLLIQETVTETIREHLTFVNIACHAVRVSVPAGYEAIAQ